MNLNNFILKSFVAVTKNGCNNLERVLNVKEVGLYNNKTMDIILGV